MEDIIDGVVYALKWIIRLVFNCLAFLGEWLWDILEWLYHTIPPKYRWVFWLVILLLLVVGIYWLFVR